MCSAPAGAWAPRCARRCSTTPSSSSSPRSTRYHAGIDLRQFGIDARRHADVARSADALADAGAEVAVDFTVVDAARDNLAWCAEQRRARGRRHHRVRRRRHRRFRAALRGVERQRGDRAELRHRRGADDALRRARRALLRDRRDHRAAPRPEDRRAVGHRDAHGRAHGRGVGRLGARPDHQDGRSRARAGEWAPAGSTSTRCACAAWSPTRRCCSARPASRCRSATTPTTARRSCPACCSRSAAVRERPGPHGRARRAARSLTPGREPGRVAPAGARGRVRRASPGGGMAKTTVDDVAARVGRVARHRSTGCSRAARTSCCARRSAGRWTGSSCTSARSSATPPTSPSSSSARCRSRGASCCEHAVLQKVLETEPDRLIRAHHRRAAPGDRGHRRLLPAAARPRPGGGPRPAGRRPRPGRRVRGPALAVADRVARAATTSTTRPRSATWCATSSSAASWRSLTR